MVGQAAAGGRAADCPVGLRLLPCACTAGRLLLPRCGARAKVALHMNATFRVCRHLILKMSEHVWPFKS